VKGIKLIAGILFSCALYSCSEQTAPLFEVLDQDKTGLDFANNLRPNGKLNMLNYMYFYNGAGMAAGDFNGDGKVDLFFCSNQGSNALYLNEGEMHFKDVTATSGIPDDGGWSTGVSVVDINQDGMLDLYICRVGQYETLQQGNLLLLCTGVDSVGIPHFSDATVAYGLQFNGFSTQAAFFDQDLDGDLDMYLLNHSLRYNSTFNARQTYFNTYDSLSGDRFYRNHDGKYVNETQTSGIHSSVIGYGLGIVVSDLNADGYPDLYIGNDFHENDYLYINNRAGGFIERLDSSMQHTSQFSMGVDAADINNDALPDVVSVDMLPEDPYILKRSLGEDEYNLFNMKLRYGYNHQYARNNLQLNRGNGLYSEVGIYAGIHATDWSWAPLWMDFDNDGLKDLFVSNGIPRRLNDIDYVNFISDAAIQEKIRSGQMSEKEMQMIEKFPQIKLRNKFFRNGGEARFTDIASSIKSDQPTFSNGAVYADLDNDGDQDIVVNNIDAAPLVYRNLHQPKPGQKQFALHLEGPKGNRQAIGTKVLVYTPQDIRTYEKYPVRGFQSSMETPLLIGLGDAHIDSIHLIWPGGTYQSLKGVDSGMVNAVFRNGLPQFDFNRQFPAPNQPLWEEKQHDLLVHQENTFNEFDREPLMPHMLSTEGPAFAVGTSIEYEVSYLFMGSSKGKKSRLLLVSKDLEQEIPCSDLSNDSTYEDVDAVFADFNNDGWQDLLVVSGGNEYYGETPYLSPRLYVNYQGEFKRSQDAFPRFDITLSCVRPYDFNADGYMDLFIGGRAMPFGYGKPVQSYLLANNKHGGFEDVTAEWAPALQQAGMVTDAQWSDMDGDQQADLVLAREWGVISILTTGKDRHLKESAIPVSAAKGWWNFVLPVDLDADGDLDLVAGNLGMNSRFKPSNESPVNMYYNDFDHNGIGEQVITYHLQGKEICFAVKSDLERHLPPLKKQFLYAEDFAKASLNDIFGSAALKQSVKWESTEMRSMVFINQGAKGFTAKPLPWQFQLSPMRAGLPKDIDQDGDMDVLLAGNYFENNVQLGRNDADFGGILRNEGSGKFVHASIPGVALKGQVRRLVSFRKGVLVVRNQGATTILLPSNK
jgi:enediyne biosynthesis protein E4